MAIAYVPILREQFNQLYRFGYTTIPFSILVETEFLESPIPVDCQRVAEKLTELSPFEYEEEYVILQIFFQHDDKEGLLTISIRDVRQIFPLNARSKEFFESRLDSRIQFQPPIFESFIVSQHTDRLWKDAEQAIRGLWEYFGFTNSNEEAWQLIPKEDIKVGLSARLRGLKAHMLKDEAYWAYVIAYDRYEVYPNGTLGYFYDAGQLYANKRGRPTFEGSQLYSLLEELRLTTTNLLFPKIKQNIEKSAVTEKYLDDTSFWSQQEQPIHGYLIAPIFLLLKDQLRDCEDVRQTILFKDTDFILRQLTNPEFKVLLTLLGCFFGYRKFYDVFYEHPPLAIFQKYLSSVELPSQSNELRIPDPLTTSVGLVSPPNYSTLVIDEPFPADVEEPQLDLGQPLGQFAEIEPKNKPIHNKEHTDEQLPLFAEQAEPHKPAKLKKGSATPILLKTDEDLLNELAIKLNQPENIGGLLIRDVATMFGRKGKDIELLLAPDPRFLVSAGKLKMVILANFSQS